MSEPAQSVGAAGAPGDGPAEAPGPIPVGDAGGEPPLGGTPPGATPPTGGTPPGGTPPAGGGRSSGGSRDEPPGLIAQVKAVRDAVVGVVRAHVALGRAEAEVIKGEVVYASSLAGVAVASLLLLAIFLPIVTMLFLGELLFGSIGWGVLLGSEMLLAIAATAAVMALKLDGPRPAAAVGVIAGIVALVVFGASWPFVLWKDLGDAMNLAIDPSVKPVVAAIIVVGAIVGLVGLILGARAAGVGGAVGGLIVGLLLGAFIGAFLAEDFGWRVGAALGFATFFAVYLVVLASRVASEGIDPEVLKRRFVPQVTIDTTKETIEWARARIPLVPKS